MKEERIRILLNYIIILLILAVVFILFSSIIENKFIIIIIYLLIGTLRTKILFLQPRGNQPVAVIRRQWGHLLLFAIILWFPVLIFSIFNNGIKIVWEAEVNAIKNVYGKN